MNYDENEDLLSSDLTVRRLERQSARHLTKVTKSQSRQLAIDAVVTCQFIASVIFLNFKHFTKLILV